MQIEYFLSPLPSCTSYPYLKNMEDKRKKKKLSLHRCTKFTLWFCFEKKKKKSLLFFPPPLVNEQFFFFGVVALCIYTRYRRYIYIFFACAWENNFFFQKAELACVRISTLYTFSPLFFALLCFAQEAKRQCVFLGLTCLCVYTLYIQHSVLYMCTCDWVKAVLFRAISPFVFGNGWRRRRRITTNIQT